MRIHRGEKEPPFIDNDVIEALPVYSSEQGTTAAFFGGVALFLMDKLTRVVLTVDEVDQIIAAANVGRRTALNKDAPIIPVKLAGPPALS